VIDTVGMRKGSFSFFFMNGTPFTEKLHVVERYQLAAYDDAKDEIERNEKENLFLPPGAGNGAEFEPDYRGNVLQLHFTVEDEGSFTMPWTATITYRPNLLPWPEQICAENQREYYNSRDSVVPQADKPDF